MPSFQGILIREVPHERGVRRANQANGGQLFRAGWPSSASCMLSCSRLTYPRHILTQSAGEHHRDHPPNHSHSIVPLAPHLCPVECQRVHLYSSVVRLPRKEYSEIPTRQFAVESLYLRQPPFYLGQVGRRVELGQYTVETFYSYIVV